MNKIAIVTLLVEGVVLALFHTFLGVGTGNFHDTTVVRILCTLIYVFLIFWGLHVGNTVGLNALKFPEQLVNPSLASKYPGRIFIIHYFVCCLHSIVLGPFFLVHGLRKWYWTSFLAMLFGSLPIVPFNYSPESFGKALGIFVTFRNVFELFLSLYLSTTLNDNDESFRILSIYHFWIWGYRLLDVGPRRLMKTLLIPSYQIVGVLLIMYLVVFWGLKENLVLFVGTPPNGSNPVDEESWLMHSGRILYCFIWYMVFYVLQKGYVKEVAATDCFEIHPAPPGGTHDDNVKNKKNGYNTIL